MSEDQDTPPGGTPFEAFLRKMLGDAGGEEAARAMRAQGFDPSHIDHAFSDPTQMQAALGQFQYFLGATEGPVNWGMARDLARQRTFQAGDPSLSAAEAERARQAMTVADLWLDATTDFAPGPLTRAAWTRLEWIEATLPMWKRFTEPVARNVSRALSDAMTSQLGDGTLPELPEGMSQMLGRTQEMMPKLAAMVFAVQIGQAISALAQEALGSTDVGLPLADAATTALVVHNVGVFGEGLDIPFDEVLQFMAVRECAHRRLFSSVPWLAGDLVRAVEKYSAEIAIDTDAIAEAARSIDPTDPSSAERALSSGVFAQEPTPRQREALERLETLLALVEGWVEVITSHAVAPYLPHAEQLREMMRRRRATGGPAEQLLGQLIGLDMRPRRARGAARIFQLVEDDQGRDAREALWSHPDMVPVVAELDAPDTFLASRAATNAQDSEIDAALASLLDGTLGWAEGLGPQVDPEAESLRRAGLDDEGAGSTDDTGTDDTDPDGGPTPGPDEDHGDSSGPDAGDASPAS